MERIRSEWLIFFYTPFNPPWYTKWRKKGYTHVGAISYQPDFKCWIMVEGLYGRLNIELMSNEEVQNVLSYVKRLHGMVIKGEEKITANFRGEWWVKEHSCVSYMQRLLGLRKFWIFTPYQLFCALRKMGFTIFVDATIKKGSSMPKVGKKMFSYGSKGMAKAKAEAKKSGKKVVMAKKTKKK